MSEEVKALLSLLKLFARFAPARVQAIILVLEALLGKEWVQKMLEEVLDFFPLAMQATESGPDCEEKADIEAVVAKYLAEHTGR